MIAEMERTKRGRRTDTHRPSAMNPADYVRVGYCDAHESDGFLEWEHEVYDAAMGLPGTGDDWRQMPPEAENDEAWDGARGRCAHCGNSRIRHWSFFLHTPSKKLVAVGSACAVKLGLASKFELENHVKANEHKAAEEARRRFEMWVAEDDSRVYLALGMAELEGADNFLDDLLRGLVKYGSLTERQLPHAHRLVAELPAQIAEQEARDAALPDPAPVIEGRIAITGLVLATKWQESDYGGALKMLVLDDRGFKVWGTVPSALGGDVREERVTFTATVERSRDDETFGFFKRPTNADYAEPALSAEDEAWQDAAQAADEARES